MCISFEEIKKAAALTNQCFFYACLAVGVGFRTASKDLLAVVVAVTVKFGTGC